MDIKSYVPVNWNMMARWENWFIVFLMVFLAALFGEIILKAGSGNLKIL